MARRPKSDRNLLKLQDNIAGCEVGIYYRTPTTKERQAYINKRASNNGGKFVDNTAANRVAFGTKIITGLREGDFEREIGEDEYQPISTDPASKDYYEEWKPWMAENCDDILTALVVRVFEVPVLPAAAGEEDLEKE